jgi:hypothetical protein
VHAQFLHDTPSQINRVKKKFYDKTFRRLLELSQMEEGKQKGLTRRNKTFLIASVISYAGNTLVIFGYFFPLEPTGASIYFAWLTLGHLLYWLRLPRVADALPWIRLLRRQHEHACSLCGSRITGTNWYCPSCKACVCLLCGANMKELGCPKCGRKLV